MQRLFVDDPSFVNGWVIVQDRRYRYMATYEPHLEVRIVLSEYLGCRIVWGLACDDESQQETDDAEDSQLSFFERD